MSKKPKNYEGKYVAYDTTGKKWRIVSSGKDLGKVFDSARKQGVEIPAIVFVPKANVTYIYWGQAA